MAVQLSSRLSALAGLFGQAPAQGNPSSFNQNVQGSAELMQLLLVRTSRDRQAFSGFLTGVGFWTAAGSTLLTVPANKLWWVTTFTVTSISGTDNMIFVPCVANSLDQPIMASADRRNAAAAGNSDIGGTTLISPALPFILKPGDQIGAWVVQTAATGDSSLTFNARFTEFESYQGS